MGSSSECYVLKWDEFHSSIANSFTDLRNEEDFLDVTVAIDQDHQLQAHKVVLSASSPYFREILKRNPAQHPVLVMPPHIRYGDLAAVIDFIYQGEVKIPISEVDEFVALAQMLKIRGLSEDAEKVDTSKKPKSQPGLPPGTQMVRKRQMGPAPAHHVPNPQAKRSRPMMMNQPKYGGQQMQQGQGGPSGGQPGGEDGDGMVDENLQEIDNEDSSDLYGEYDEQYEGQEFSMEGHPQAPQPPQPAQQGGSSASGLKLTALVCPKCRQMCHGVDALKDHMAKSHGIPNEEEKKTYNCHICDKAFKAHKNVQAHIKRVHKVGPNTSAATGGEGHEGEGMMMDPQHPEAPPTGKKKGRPKKSEQPQSTARPIGQVPPAPRTQHDMKEVHEQSRPPIQQDRGASPMVSRQRPPGVMSPSGPHGMSQPSVKRTMAPQGIMGPGMRPRGPVPQQHQYQQNFPQPPPPPQSQQPHPMDIKKLGMKLGGSISITSSEASFSGGASAQPSPMRRGGPSTSRMHSASPKSSDPASASRASSLPQRHLSQEQPVEVKMEPMDDMYEEGEEMPEDFEEEGEGFGDEEEEEEEEDDEEFEQEGMYAGEPPYDDDVVHDSGYTQ